MKRFLTWLRSWRNGIRLGETAVIIGLWSTGITAGRPVVAQSLLFVGLAVGIIALLAEPGIKTTKWIASAVVLAACFGAAELEYRLDRPAFGQPMERVIERESVRYYPEPNNGRAVIATKSSAAPSAATPSLTAPQPTTRARTGTDNNQIELHPHADPNPTSVLDTPPNARDAMKAELEEMYLSASGLLDRTIVLPADGDIPQAQKDFDSFDTSSRIWLGSNAGPIISEEFRTEHQFTYGTPWAGDHDIAIVNQRQRIIDGLKSRRMNLRELITGKIEQEQSNAAQPFPLLFQDLS